MKIDKFSDELVPSIDNILEIALKRYKYDTSDMDKDDVRLQAGVICFDISQNLLKLLSLFENNFELFDVNEREGDKYYQVNSISIFSLLSAIEKYESLSMLFGISDDVIEGNDLLRNHQIGWKSVK